MPLSVKQKEFGDQYLVDLNATQAAIRAGYSPKTANEQASRLLAVVSIQEYICAKREKLKEKLDISQERVLEELATVAFSKVTDFLEIKNKKIRTKIITTVQIFETQSISELKIRAIASIKQGPNGIEIKLHDKVKAIELLGKHLGIFEKDNAQKKVDITPFTDNQVDKILDTIRANKNN